MGLTRKISFFLFLFLLISGAYAQMAYVKGYAKGAESKTICVKTYDDLISYKEKKLASTKIDSSGHFELTVSTRETIYAWFEIEYYIGEIYLDPGTHHAFELKGLEFTDEKDHINTFLEPLYMQVVVRDTNDVLNRSVQKLNVIYNRFLYAHLNELTNREFKKTIDSLEVALDTTFSKVKLSFFKDYLTYRMASLELMNQQASNDNLFFKYLYHRPVQYLNVEYMSFFSDYFENYFQAIDRPVNLDVMRFIINKQGSFPALLDSMGADTLLWNEVLRECVMLEILKTVYGIPNFKRDNIIEILRQVSTDSKFEQHKKIASNLISVLRKNDKGQPAKEFALLTAADDTVKLKDYRGKYVYLNFFTTWNISCLQELELMRKLYDKYSQSVQFISICCDREFMKMYHFSREKKYPWPLIHFNNDYDLLDDFGVSNYPHFVLLDRKGNFITDHAESPSQNIEKKFNELIQGQ
jgi:peroxiredoxin